MPGCFSVRERPKGEGGQGRLDARDAQRERAAQQGFGRANSLGPWGFQIALDRAHLAD